MATIQRTLAVVLVVFGVVKIVRGDLVIGIVMNVGGLLDTGGAGKVSLAA